MPRAPSRDRDRLLTMATHVIIHNAVYKSLMGARGPTQLRKQYVFIYRYHSLRFHAQRLVALRGVSGTRKPLQQGMREKCLCAAPDVHSAHAIFFSAKALLAAHNQPTPWTGPMAPACKLPHVFPGINS